MFDLNELPDDLNSKLSDGMGIEDLMNCTQPASPGGGTKNADVMVESSNPAVAQNVAPLR